MAANKNLQLNVSNFGPIAKAKIDLRPLTVFVGPSNTGKSYLAILIYALHRFFSGAALRPSSQSSSDVESIYYLQDLIQDDFGADEKQEHIQALINWIRQIHNNRGTSGKDISLPSLVDALIRPALNLDSRESVIKYETVRCFGVDDIRRLVRYTARNEGNIIVSRQVSDDVTKYEPFEYHLTMINSEVRLASLIPKIPPFQVVQREDLQPDYWEQINKDLSMFLNVYSAEPTTFQHYLDRNIFFRQLLRTLSHMVGSSIVDPLSHSAYYLPADRTGIMHAHRVVVGSLISRASQAGLRAESVQPVLSGVLADFLERLIGLGDSDDKSKAPGREFAARVERNMLRGAIRRELSFIGYPVLFYRPDGWKENIPLMNSSSMISELAPVVLYLRHVVKPGEVLIIEEPESHLHPAMQVELIRHLAAAVRSGIRIMLTTHSEWVLEELANLVRLSDLPESERESVEGGDISLTPEEVGVWLFDPSKRPRGSIVKEIPLDRDLGGFESGYEDVAIGTYNRWARIGNLIEEAHNGT